MLIFLKSKNKLNIKKLFILLLTLLLTYIFIIKMDQLYFSLKQSSGSNNQNLINITKIDEYTKNGVSESLKSGGTGRTTIWKNTLGVVKDNFITGVGFDNLYLAYPNSKSEGISIFYTDGKLTTESKIIYIVDNAHNVYLHILASQGIIGLIPYLLMCLLVFIKGLKSKNNYTYILLGGFVVYSIQAFANISVVQVAPIYYIIMGLILSCEMKTQT